MLTIALIIACLPTIMGVVALCFIIYFIYKVANGLFADRTEQTVNYERQGHTSQQQYEQGAGSETVNNKRSYSHYRKTNYDHYDDYYDEWRVNDMPTEGGDGFRGTGAPFL